MLFAEQLVDKLRLRELMREKTLVEGDIANSKAEIAKSEEQMSELRSQLLARKKDIQDKIFISLKELHHTELPGILPEVRSITILLVLQLIIKLCLMVYNG